LASLALVAMSKGLQPRVTSVRRAATAVAPLRADLRREQGRYAGGTSCRMAAGNRRQLAPGGRSEGQADRLHAIDERIVVV